MGKKSKLMIIEDVTKQTRQSGKVGPILPVFQHASCNPTQLVENSSTEVTASWDGDKPNIGVTITTDNMTYQSVEGGGNSLYTTYLALRDKRTGKTRLVEANTVVMKPKVNYPQSKNPLLLEEESKEAKTLAEKLEASKHLIKSFGQAKGSRFYDQQERMKVDSTQIEDKVTRAAGAVTEDRLAAAPAAEAVQVLPTRNEAAARKEQVYLLENMLSKHDVKSLGEAADTVFADYKNLEDLEAAKKDRVLSAMGVSLLHQCILQTEADVSEKAATILYMEGIIKFSRLRQGEMKKGPKSLQNFLPLSVKKKIFDQFSVGGGGGSNNRILTPEMTDRAICHIMVLGLLASNYKLDTSLLTESVRVRPDHLKKLVAMVGAHLHSDSLTQQQLIVLKLPLATFNINYVGKKKGGKR